MSGKVIDVFLITADIAWERRERERERETGAMGRQRANSIRRLRGSTERRTEWR
jgi:hypothetical protein